MEDLLRSDWSGVDSGDLVAVLSETFGGSQLVGEDAVSYPNADEARITIHYGDGLMNAITPGPAFDKVEWAAVSQRVEKELIESTPATARQIAFCGYRVKGWWRSEKLGLQILLPPPDAPDASVELADHPFVIEFPVMKSANWLITSNRRTREYKRLTALLNILLEGQVTSGPSMARHFWAFLKDATEVGWVQEGYFCPNFHVEADALSIPTGEPMAVVSTPHYYSAYGHEIGRGLQIPDTLERSLAAYHGLPPAQRERFDRACYWWDMKDRFWSASQSASYGALVTAVEALIDEPRGHGSCPACHRSLAPGPTKLFRNFLEAYVPGGAMAQARARMYGVRSAISHGGRLMGNDLDVEWGLNPAKISERSLHSDLWRLVRIALINWLHTAADNSSDMLELLPPKRGRMFSKTVSIQGGKPANS